MADIFMTLPMGINTGHGDHVMLNIRDIEAVKQVGKNDGFLHSDVYMRSGKIWQTPFTEVQVFTQMGIAASVGYVEVDDLPLAMPGLPSR